MLSALLSAPVMPSLPSLITARPLSAATAVVCREKQLRLRDAAHDGEHAVVHLAGHTGAARPGGERRPDPRHLLLRR